MLTTRLVLLACAILVIAPCVYANDPLTCDTFQKDNAGSCANSDDCVNLCALSVRRGASLNPQVPGFILAYDSNKFLIAGIIPFSPASDAGLRRGDQVLSVDGMPFPAAADIWSKGVTHALRVRRSGQILRISITAVSESALLARITARSKINAAPFVELSEFSENRSIEPLHLSSMPFVSGLAVGPKGGALQVESVLPASAAAKQGMRSGDTIASSSCSMRMLEGSSVRSTCDLRIKEYGATRIVRITMTSRSQILRNLANSSPDFGLSK